MSADRWSDETVEAVAEAIHHPQSGRWVGADEDYRNYCRSRARVVLAVLDEEGLLLRPSGTGHVEWAYGYPHVDPFMVWLATSELDAREHADVMANEDGSVQVLSRTVRPHVGPWREHPHPTAAAHASAAVSPLSQPPTTAPGDSGGVGSPTSTPPP